MSRLRAFNARRNNLSGALDDAFFKPCVSLMFMDVQFNWLAGSLPAAIGVLRAFWMMLFNQNAFSGSLPGALGSLRRLEHLAISSNHLSGCMPDGACSLRTLWSMELYWNDISGTIPMAYCHLHKLTSVDLSTNRFSGSLPDALGQLTSSKMLLLAGNQFAGTLPAALQRQRLVMHLIANSNKISGSIPECITVLRALNQILRLAENHLSGAIPAGFHRLRGLLCFMCDKNLLEGSMPASFTMLQHMRFLGVGGEPQRPGQLFGPLGAGLSRMRALDMISMHWQRLQGAIPALGGASLRHVVLHRNSFQTLSRLDLADNAICVLLHRNRLSCRLPTHRASHQVHVAMAALGNHLSRPTRSHPTSWVAQYERSSLFWISDGGALWLLLRSLAGLFLFCWAFGQQVGSSKFLMMASWWKACRAHQGVAQVTNSLLSCMVRLALGSHLLLLLVLQSNYYACRDGLTLASACLLKTTPVQTMVVILWGQLMSAALEPWWGVGCHVRMYNQKQTAMRGGFYWACWICLLLLVSCPTLLDIIAAIVPSFLQLGVHWVRLLHACVGGYQALASGVLIPVLTGRAVGVRKPTLISIAYALSNWMIPASTVLHLGWDCFDQWGRWWPPCARSHMFEVFSPTATFDQNQRTRLRVLQHGDVCGASRQFSKATCARSLALKLQDMLLGKLIMTVFLLPSFRIASGRRLYGKTDQLAQSLALLLELGMLWGPSLPLLTPFLAFGVLSQQVVAVASSWSKGGLQGTARHADARMAIALAGVCSLIHHGCFVSEDVAATCLIFLFMLWVLMKMFGTTTSECP